MRSGAGISDDQKYRWWLSRIWNDYLPCVLFIMLNPSTADARNNDPTVTRCIGFAKRWGFGGLYVCNVYAYRAADPDDLKMAWELGEDITGAQCFAWVKTILYYRKVTETIFAWGAGIIDEDDALGIEALFTEARCLGKNKDDTPKHPLYLPGDAARVSYNE